MCGEVMVCNIRVVFWETVYVVLSYCPATWTADNILPADRTAVNFVNTFPSRVERYHRLLICCWYCLCCHGNDTDMQDKTSPLLRIGLYIAAAKQLVPTWLLLISHYHFYTSHAYVFDSGIFIVSESRSTPSQGRPFKIHSYSLIERLLKAEMEPGLRVTGHRVSDFGRVGSGHGSVCQTRCLTRFWVLTCAFYRGVVSTE